MIHPTAIIEKGAQLGTNCEIGPFAYVGAKARLGDGCRLGPHACVLDYATLGARCTLHAGAVIGDLPQDLSFGGWESYVEIGDDCTFREGATVHRGTDEGSTTRIGNHVYMMAYSHFAHNTVIGDHVIAANCALIAGHVHVGEHTFLGGGCAIHQHVHLGRYVMISGVLGVVKDVPSFCTTSVMTLGGVIAGLNVVGLRRGGFTPAQRAEIKKVYNIVFRSGLNVHQAADRLRAEMPESPYAAEYLAFIADSKRGLGSEARRHATAIAPAAPADA